VPPRLVVEFLERLAGPKHSARGLLLGVDERDADTFSFFLYYITV